MQQKFAFILFSPDCTVTRLYGDAINWLRSRKIGFLAFSWKRLSPIDTHNLYLRNRSSRAHTDLDDLVDELFSLDYSLACLVNFEKDTFPEEILHSKLMEFKGPSNPHQAKSIHIRRYLGATNKILNFIHTSDDFNATLHEANIFFDLKSTKIFLKDRCENILPPPPCDLGKLRSVSGFSIRLELKKRLIYSLKIPLDSPFNLLLEKEKGLLDSYRDHLSINQELSVLLQKQHELAVITIKQKLLQTALLSLIEASLAKTEGLCSISGLIKILEVTGCQLSQWEHLTIRCEESTV